MLGTFQHSNIRIEIDAPATAIRDSLLCPDRLQKWLWPQQLSSGIPETLHPGVTFSTAIGPVKVQHHVEVAEDNCLRLILSEGIDGFHQWHWGDGWVQSNLEGISLLPLNLGQTFTLVRLRDFLKTQET